MDNTAGVEVPTRWYNIIADLPFELPPDIAPEAVPGQSAHLALQLPLALYRQSTGLSADVEIPREVLDLYRSWRPTPLRRARNLEAALGTPARIYYKYEGDNVSGSHKLATGIAQAYYYRQMGARRLTTGTGAGQWGTALAVGCQAFGLQCKVYMVGTSFAQKPQRRTIMRLYGAEVVASPSGDTRVGARLRTEGQIDVSNMAFAVSEALEDALDHEGSHLSVGSGEAYSILHSTVIGLEAEEQLSAMGEWPDVVLASLGAGSNFGGIALPFLKRSLREQRQVRCVSVESTACPKLTRGVYRYDRTDGSGVTPLQKMYTLGHQFRSSPMHAGGLRYHACSKVISALYHHGLTEAVAYSQDEVFASAQKFAKCEWIVPAPESAHAVHGAIQEALKAKERGKESVILFCLSGHGMYDLSSYAEFLDGRIQSVALDESAIQSSLDHLPRVAAS